ncbi:hypothetical protein [Oscillatoria sp. FACHB-1406]|uniref:hypothetical protein n=1 Tax=Oscillatoria sp. FACHB-1406 TaxID=2692846 RepID=UPI0016883C71|nr:hypothetical protein [Oscillatoria sp. FACHB-1406]MBD2578460.1 hypothetical protein [Oscillatoria sp. FACHB-1406]
MCKYNGTDREYECEYASEYESEQFFPLLAPLLAKAAPIAIKAVGGLLGGGKKRRQREFEFEYEYEGEYEGDPFIGNLLRGLGNSFGLGEGEYEYEYEYETTPMSEYEIVMENLAYRAAHSESEAEAEAFLGALVPMAARLIPSAAKAITSLAPTLVRGVSQIGHALHKNPTTRQLLQTAPDILKGTVQTLANQVEQGQPLSSKTALRALAANTANVLDNPQKVKAAMKKSHRAQHQAKAIASRNGKRSRVPA